MIHNRFIQTDFSNSHLKGFKFSLILGEQKPRIMRTIVTITALSMMVSASAQYAPASIDNAQPSVKRHLTGFETLNLNTTGNSGSRIILDSLIGETYYDLQTNGSVQNRCNRYSDGTNAAAWTFSSQTSSSFTDRGTGYNYFDGNQWGPISYTRIEDERTGWPSLLYTAGGTELVIAHTAGAQLKVSSRSGKGSGAWSYSYVTSNISNGLLWPRAVVGGANGNTIHVVAITEPEANGGTPYMGIDGTLLYFRSTDQGASWDIVDSIIPGTGDSTVFGYYSGDSYSIIANGDNVAIVCYNGWGDSWVAKSADNGDNWTYTQILDFAIDDYNVDDGSDADNNGTFDTLTTTDGAGAAVMDDQGNVHVFYGSMRVMDDDTTDGNTSYFPGTNGLMYWNETMPVGGAVVIAGAEDYNNNGTIDIASATWPGYFVGLASIPTVGMNNDGTIFVTYCGFREDFFTSTQNYRHIFCMKSTDGGANWTMPVDVTPDLNGDGLEFIFASMAEQVDDRVRFWVQQDFEPGLAVRGDMDPIALNSILFYEVDSILSQDVGIRHLNGALEDADIYPNPANETMSLEFGLKKNIEGRIYVTDMLGKVVMNVYTGSLSAGTHRQTLNLTNLSEGVYHLILESGTERINKQFVVTH